MPPSVMSTRDLPYIGIKPAISSKSTADLNAELIEKYLASGYDYVLSPITNTEYREKAKRIFHIARTTNELVVPRPSITDVCLFCGPHLNRTIGLLSSWTELESDNDLISEFSKQVLINELEYSKFIGLTHIIIAPPKNLLKLSNYTKMLMNALSITKEHQITISISLPLCEELQSSSSTDCLSTWDMWNSIRTGVDYDRRLKVSLAIPKGSIPLVAMDRWFAEPVTCILVSSSVFAINNKGYPVLTKPNQTIITQFQCKKPIFLLHGLEKAPENIDSSSYMQYINYIVLKNQQSLSKIDIVSRRHNDILLPPLQPLQTNLDNYTYSVFEEDKAKYEIYGKAIYAALSDMSHLNNINVAIVGAGKGGLVQAAFEAIRSLKLESKTRITAIEKNHSAIIYLQRRNIEKWEGAVEILSIDMRDWSPRESFNIIISELLGSFGCNELSPECLVAIEKNVDRSNGVFIPQSYSSHIAPIFTPELHKTLKERNDLKAFEKHYVVRLLESAICSTKTNEVWSFEHPATSNASLKRNVISTFKIRHKTVIHGFAGFFTAKLYKDIKMSIVPETHTPDLVSWFPMFFPIDTPLYLSDDTELEISLSREGRDGKVWYSWSLEAFMYLVLQGETNSNEFQMRVRTGMSRIHNSDGSGFEIRER